jgi:Fic family protein/DNA-binding XRE family transcriptional regulator
MKTLIKNARVLKNLRSRELAQLMGIDQTLISRFESGKRLPTRDQITQMSIHLDIDIDELLVVWLKEKILSEIGDEPMAEAALQMVNEEIGKYNVSPKVSDDLKSLLKEIEVLKSKLDKLRQFDSFRIAQALELEYTFESNRIEGNTLTLRETDLVVNEGLTISGKSMREHLEAINHKEAIDYMKDLVHRKVTINEREVLSIHNLILRGILPEDAGKYRSVQVMIKGSSHMPPQPFLVAKQMEDYFIWFAKNRKRLHPIILAAEMHERLVTIHPFIDGNGRTSRLIMNLILLKNGYVIANMKGDSESRSAYYEALEKVQTKNDKESFHLLVAKVEKECLERYLSILGN